MNEEYLGRPGDTFYTWQARRQSHAALLANLAALQRVDPGITIDVRKDRINVSGNFRDMPKDIFSELAQRGCYQTYPGWVLPFNADALVRSIWKDGTQ